MQNLLVDLLAERFASLQISRFDLFVERQWLHFNFGPPDGWKFFAISFSWFKFLRLLSEFCKGLSMLWRRRLKYQIPAVGWNSRELKIAMY